MFAAKAALLAFWTLWSASRATHVGSALKALNVLPRSWKFASDNFRAIADAAAAYRATQPLATALFFGVILMAACRVLFSRARPPLRGAAERLLIRRAVTRSWRDAAYGPLSWSPMRFFSSTRTLFIAQLAALIALHMLRD